jgi:hypothetical protein
MRDACCDEWLLILMYEGYHRPANLITAVVMLDPMPLSVRSAMHPVWHTRCVVLQIHSAVFRSSSASVAASDLEGSIAEIQRAIIGNGRNTSL